jgi:hypothetical protein
VLDDGYTFLRFPFQFSDGKRVEASRFPSENLPQKSIYDGVSIFQKIKAQGKVWIAVCFWFKSSFFQL